METEKLSDLAAQFKEFWDIQACLGVRTLLEAAYEELAATLLKIVRLTLTRPHETPQKPRFPAGTMALFDEDVFDRASRILRDGSMSMQRDETKDIGDMITAKTNSALLIKAIIIRAIYTAAIDGQIDRLKDLVKVAIKHDTDMACEILDQMFLVWGKNDSSDVLVALLDIYRMVLLTSWVSNTRSSALRNLAVIFDIFLERVAFERAVSVHELHLLEISSLSSGSPDLSNAEIKVTGSLLLLHLLSQGQTENFTKISEKTKEQIEAWGCMLSAVGKAENVGINFATHVTAF